MHLVKNKYCFVSSISMNEHEMLLCVVEAGTQAHSLSKQNCDADSICAPLSLLHSVCLSIIVTVTTKLKCVCQSSFKLIPS